MKNIQTDVAIIGSGAAGMAAALTIAEAGAKAFVFEKRSAPGGTSNLPRGGIFAVESKYQLEKKYPFSREDVFESFMKFTHCRSHTGLLRAFIYKTADTIDWLEKQGIEFNELPPPVPHLPGGYATGHPIKGNGVALMKTLRERAKEKGIAVHLNTAADKIIIENNRVSGVSVTTRSEKVRVNSSAVVVATGGFSSNKKMIKKYTGFDLEKNLFPLFDLDMTGDGIKMAWEAGAVSDGIGPQLIVGIPGPGFFESQVPVIQNQPYLWVNQNGERFINETIINNPAFAANAIARQKKRCAYLVFDGDTKRHMEEDGVDNISMFFPDPKIKDLDSHVKLLKKKKNRNVFVADSLDKLAKKIRVDPSSLQETADKYNKFCEKGHDGDFNKDPKFLRQIKTPKFYAFRIYPSMYGTLGGIKINEKAEVLNKEDFTIPGLYAAGYDACNIFGNPPSYNFFAPGGTYSFALNSGRIAGESALKYIRR